MSTTSGYSGDNVCARTLPDIRRVDIAGDEGFWPEGNNPSDPCCNDTTEETYCNKSSEVKSDNVYNMKHGREPVHFTFPSPRFDHAGLYGKVKDKFPVSEDFKIMCRLIGLHTRNDIRPGSELTLGQTRESFTIIDTICIGNNVKCLIIEESIEQYKIRMRRDLQVLLRNNSLSDNLDKFHHKVSCLNSNGIHTIFAFNWFSPPTLLSYLNLGSELLFRTGLDNRYNRILGKVYLQKADDFLWNPQMRNYLQKKNFTQHSKFPICKLTLTGFSLGGAISHALAFLLKEHESISCGIRVISFGSPRVGSEAFTQWFAKNLDLDSHNIILTSTNNTSTIQSNQDNNSLQFDPVTLSPSIDEGFDYHPATLLLDHSGLLMPFNDEDSSHNVDHIAIRPNTTSPWYSTFLRRLGFAYDAETWAKLHSLTKYYQAMLSYNST